MTRREWTTRCARQPDGTVTDYGTKSDHIGGTNKMITPDHIPDAGNMVAPDGSAA